jgi:hypothetical protein
LFLAHLEFTAHTSISALRYNNVEAAGWGVDMLNNWIDKLAVREHGHGLEEYRWHSELVTHDMLLKSSDDQLWQTVLNGNEFNLRSAFNIALKNAAFDLRVITACYILLKPNSNNDDQIKQYVSALLSCAAIHPTGSIGGRTKSVAKASDIIGAYIRHRDYANYGEGTYGSWLSQVLDSFGRVNEKRRVSGRIYSGWGRDDPHSMNSAYVEIAVSFSTNEWQLERKWFDIVFSDAFRHMDQESLIRDLKSWLRIVGEIESPQLISTAELANNMDKFKASIQKIIDRINQHQNEVVAEAEVDEALLTQYGSTCSEFFNHVHSSPKFPINLFNLISTNGSRTPNTLNIINISPYSKELIALGISSNRVEDEADHFKGFIVDNIQEKVLRKIFNYQVTNSKVYNNSEQHIKGLIAFSENIQDPILFIDDIELDSVLSEARYNQNVANKYGISFADGYGHYYLCHIGEIEVYSVHFSNEQLSILTTKELFEAVEFTKVADEQFVDVNYLASEENENIGVLSFNYWMDITLKEDLPCIKTELKIKEEE